MDRKRLSLLFVVLIALMVSSCSSGTSAPASALPPTAAAETAAAATVAPTQTANPEPTMAALAQTPTTEPTPAMAVEPTATAAATAADATVAPTQTTVTEPTAAAELPALLGHLHWLGHASFRFDGPPTIYLDPTSVGSDMPTADIILVSHEHGDHYAPATLKEISKPETVILTNPRVAAMLEKVEGLEGQVRALQPGERLTVGEVEIEAVPAYNIGKANHPQTAGGLGFIVTWGGERLYFAGDTSRIPEMADIDCDVALLPIDGTYTMDVAEAAQAAADIGPKVAVPMHMRSADPEQFRSLCDCTVVIMEVEP